MEINSWGYHLILDLNKCDSSSIKSYDNIFNFTKQLVKDIDMVAYGEPQIVKFGSGNKCGYTLIQLIETSNISAHFCEETGDVYLDVFSCKSFDNNVVIDLVNRYFNPKNIKSSFIYRDAASLEDILLS